MATERVVVKVGNRGRIVIPARFRRALDLRVGDTVTFEVDDTGITITSRAANIRRAQRTMAPYRRAGSSMAEELLAERRAEANS